MVPAPHIGSTDHIGLAGDDESGKTTCARRMCAMCVFMFSSHAV